MKRLLVFLLAASLGWADIDLTPHQSVRELQGCKFPEIRFRSRDGEIAYEPPNGWAPSGRGKSQVYFYIADKPQAYARIEEVSVDPEEFDETFVAQLKAELIKALPEGSKSIVITREVASPLTINKHDTYEAVVNFVVNAQRFTTSVLFLNLKNSQLRFTVSTPESMFEELHDRFTQSLYSWQWLDLPAQRSEFRRSSLRLR